MENTGNKIKSINNSIKSSGRVQTLTLRLSPEEKEVIKAKASKAKMSVNQFVVTTALESQESTNEDAFELGRRLVRLSRLADQIEDDMRKQIAKEQVSRFWQR